LETLSVLTIARVTARLATLAVEMESFEENRRKEEMVYIQPASPSY
jgi:hypothetical protein